MKFAIYFLVVISAFLHGFQGFSILSLSGPGQYLDGNSSTSAILSVIGALLLVVGLFGLIKGVEWGKWTTVAGLIAGLFAAIIMMTAGTTPLLHLVFPLIALILVLLNKGK